MKRQRKCSEASGSAPKKSLTKISDFFSRRSTCVPPVQGSANGALMSTTAEVLQPQARAALRPNPDAVPSTSTPVISASVDDLHSNSSEWDVTSPADTGKESGEECTRECSMKTAESEGEREEPFKQFTPKPSYQFPWNKEGRCCRHDWFTLFNWLHYVQGNDRVLCSTCLLARRSGKKAATRGNEDAFNKVGFSSWKTAIAKFKNHESSQCHRESIELEHLRRFKTGKKIENIVDRSLATEQKAACSALRLIVSSVRYLARTGQALRGTDSDGGNLVELLEERTLKSPELEKWLARRDKWLSSDIQNEIIELLAHNVQRSLVETIKKSDFFSVMADGTTDVAGDKQFAVCIRSVVGDTFEVKGLFISLFQPSDGKAKTLFKTLKDIMTRLDLSIANLRGHCFDGAAVMSGNLIGVQKRITDEQPKSVFVHCSNYSHDLVLQEIARRCELIADTLSTVKDVSNAILDSSKRKEMYAGIVLPPCVQEKGSRLLALCPTRWCFRLKSLRRFEENYVRVTKTLEEILGDQGCKLMDDRKVSLKGCLKKMGKFKTLLALKLGIRIFEPAELLATALQSDNFTASGAKHAADTLWRTYNNMGEPDFERAWRDAEERSKGLNLEMPKPPRQSRPPRRFEDPDMPDSNDRQVPDEKTRLRAQFIQILDWLKNELQRRFKQRGLEQLIKFEEVLLSPWTEPKYTSANVLSDVLGVHADDFELDLLAAQLKIFRSALREDFKPSSVKDLAKAMRDLPADCRRVLKQVQKLPLVLLTVPATSASCERSFSALRRIKSYLRSMMTQRRLTHLLLLHVHSDLTKKINLDEIVNEFVRRTQERRKVLGNL